MSPASTLDVLLHPVRLRILQAVAGRQLTTVELAGLLEDVGPATVYRHVSALLDRGVLRVVAERRVRGAVERTIALGEESAHADPDDIRAMTDDQHRKAFAVFVAHLASNFDRFIGSGEGRPMSLFGYSQAVLYLTEEDLQEVQEELLGLLSPYFERRSDADQRVNLTTLLIPDDDGRRDTDAPEA